MNRLVLIILIFFSLIAGSCSSRKNRIDRNNLIPPKELTSILTDLYITDGLLTLPDIHRWYSQLDTLGAYKDVIEKHGYTKEAMDKTIKYYYIKDPKGLIRIYDQVLAILSEMDSRFEKEAISMQGRVSNLWNGKEFYSFPDFSGTELTDFNIAINSTGLYVLSFTVTLFPDDQSVNTRLTVYTCNPDSIETGKRHHIKTIAYIKDGQPHTYSLLIPVADRSHFYLKGKFYDYDNSPDEYGKILHIEKISFTYTSGAV